MIGMAKTNIHYVSMLVYSPTDPCDVNSRLEWLKSLIETQVPLTLFIDSHYYDSLTQSTWFHAASHPDLTLAPWSLEDSGTWKLCAGDLTPPDNRNTGKDSKFFLALMNAKTELVGRVAEKSAAPFVAFVDAGIRKVFKTPEESFERLRNLRIRPDLSGTLIPGCWPPTPWSQDSLAKRICWTFCGGFFVVPAAEASNLAAKARGALETFVASGRLTWEVNVWVHMMCLRDSPEINWFQADHNDRMTMIPAEYLDAL